MATILLVDDEPANRLLLTAILRSRGHETFEAESAERALAMLRERSIDLTIADLYMPGTDGAELVRRIRADSQLRAANVAFYTASAGDAALPGLMEILNVRHVIAKPCEPHEVLAVVDAALRDP